MKHWKSALFGDTTTNFYGWVIMGGGLILLSIRLMDLAFQQKEVVGVLKYSLASIWMVLIAHLALALQNYTSRVAAHLERETELPTPEASKKTEGSDTPA